MSRTSTEAAAIPLLPVCRSFLMVDGHLYSRTPHLCRLPNRYLSIPPVQPHPQLIHTRTPISRPPFLCMLTPSYLPPFLLAFAVVFGNLLHHIVSYITTQDSPTPPAPSSRPYFSLLPLTICASHGDCVCFLLREHTRVEMFKPSARLNDVIAICPR